MTKILSITSAENLRKKKFLNGNFDTVILSLPIHSVDITNPFSDSIKNPQTAKSIGELVVQSAQCLNKDGYLFIYGSPIQLIEAYKSIPKEIKFRYWISIDVQNGIEEIRGNHLKHSHLGLLMLSKGKYLPLNTKGTRQPYFACSACGKNLKDWGGKKHLMNTRGAGMSDVWRDFYKILKTKIDPDNRVIKLNVVDMEESVIKLSNLGLPKVIEERLLSLIDEPKRKVLIINLRAENLTSLAEQTNKTSMVVTFPTPKELENKVILGDCINVMEKLVQKYPDGVFDLVFADPPYNLQKKYTVYDDALADQEYIQWCNRWLELSIQLLKPTGSLLVLNIPKWALEHAKHLNRVAFLQNWIVWDALSTPKGKIMPAHYSLLYYTKSLSGHTFNKPASIPHRTYCVRNSCISSRNNLYTQARTVEVSDFWSDLHRIKHKKNRDNHPCQLPDSLMDRIIKTFSNEQDLVFDPFAGAGTTAIRALKNNRKYMTVEIDPAYKEITENKLREIAGGNEIVRTVVKKQKTFYTKKFLETKAQELSARLGKKPTMNEFVETFSLDMRAISELYERPERVLKAGRIGLLNSSH